MRLLLVCLVLLGTSWVGTEALSLTDLLGISYNTTSAPVTDDQPPSHAHHHHHHHGHGHSTDDEDASDAHASHAHHVHGHSHTTDDEDGSDAHASHVHHHHGHAHTNMDGDDTPQEYPHHHPHEHHDDEGDDDSTPLDHRHPHPHHHHGHNHDLDGNEEHGHDSERLRHHSHHHHHNHTHHNHTNHHNHSHPHDHNHSRPHHHHPNHPHHPHHHHPHNHDHSPHRFQDYRAHDRSIFTFGDPMSLDERRQHNRWTSSTNKSPNTGSHHGHLHIRPNLSGPHHVPPPAHGPRTLYTYPFARPIPPFDHPFHRDPHGHTPHHHTGPHTHHIHIPQPTNAHIYPHHYSPVPPLSTTPRRLRCPMLYSLIGDRCIAIFSIARMPWNDAEQFCEGIFGELFTFSDIKEYHDMVVYLRQKGLTSPMWIGGRELLNGNWWWVNGESIMPKGTPYWAVRATSRRGAPTMQLPEAGRDGVGRRCAAMNPEDFYYLSDAECDDHKVPVCVLTGNAVVMALGDIMAPSSLYPALEPRTCRNWMLSKESSEASREEDSDDKSEEGSTEGEKTTQESHKKNSEEGKGTDGNQVDASEGVFEKEGEGSGGNKDEGTEDGTGKEDDENKQEGVSQITTTPTPDGAEDETAVEDDTDTSSGSGVGETIFGDDEDLVEGSGNDYYFMWRLGDY